MGKKKKEKSASERYLEASRGGPWESKADYKNSKKYWNNAALQARQPAGYDMFRYREAAWLDQRASEKNNKNSSKNNGKGKGANGGRASGEYEDIRKAQEEDRKLGEQQAKRIRELEAKLGGISPEVQKQLDSLTLANTNLTDTLEQTNVEWQNKLDQANQNSQNVINQMQALMLQQQQSSSSTQQLLQSQLNSTQAALENQQRMSANLATAYVPPAETSAQSVVYGDTRVQRRRQIDNSLSDLSIVSGLGNNNSLTGLQF